LWIDDGDVRLYKGDALEQLAAMPAESVQCIVTSPPFWALRDYGTGRWDGGDADCDHKGPPAVSTASTLRGNGHAGGGPQLREQTGPTGKTCPKCGATRVDDQIGLESTPDEWCMRLVAVFRECRRVLRNDGVMWLEVGDTYNAGRDGGWAGGKRGISKPENAPKQSGVNAPGLKPKDLVGAPWLLAFALRGDGWYLRSDTIWARPNPMPESVTDRPTKAHSYVFLLTKSARYFYDADAIREESKDWSKGGPGEGIQTTEHYGAGNGGNADLGSLATRYKNGDVPAGRNARSVWSIATEPAPFAHFATFPQALVERCIKAGTSEHGACAACGAPWTRTVSHGMDESRPQAKRALQLAESLTPEHIDALRAAGISDVGKALVTTNGAGRNTDEVQRLADEARKVLGGYAREFLIKGTTTTTGWVASCDCNAATRPCVVLDPFMGSGTTALVARRLGRHAVGVELNEEYLAIAWQRLDQLSLFAP
jgi:DNA modification methylase